MKATGTSTNQKQLAWWAESAFVYFIAAGDPPVAIKIGVTTQATLVSRMAALQSSNHERLRLLGVLPFTGGEFPMKEAEDKERRLHSQFAHLQRTKEGKRGHEWFTAGTDLVDFIEKNAVKP